MGHKAFTLIELILIIAIVGILAISALPKFFNLSSDAEIAAQNGVVGAVRSGIALYRANEMVTKGGAGSYPKTLESGACCFGAILANPVEGWNTTDNINYTCVGTGNIFTYNSREGTFDKKR